MEGRTNRFRAEVGQSTLEWTGLVLLVSILFTGLLAAGIGVPGTALIHSVTKQMLCAASLSTACAREPSLGHTYGERIASEIRKHSPDLLFGRDRLGLPVDYRTCRSAYCADGPDRGEVLESTAGEPVTLFTRVLDCRAGSTGAGADRGADAAMDCSGDRAGRLFITYWAYYPESASLRGVPVLERKGHHVHDWESLQVRIDPDGTVAQRASSHAGYNHGRSVANWGSDMGWGLLRKAAESTGLRSRGGWGDPTGRYLIAGGSHAGNVDGKVDGSRYPSFTPGHKVRLVPLEKIRRDPIARPARFDPITPPWEKDVWLDPEAEGTG
ncbi:MAG: hypothetical protein M3Y45_06805 [Actinomycetota bacterium]|nr:hypothetical protein [Actinomycetota bacterium]